MFIFLQLLREKYYKLSRIEICAPLLEFAPLALTLLPCSENGPADNVVVRSYCVGLCKCPKRGSKNRSVFYPFGRPGSNTSAYFD